MEARRVEQVDLHSAPLGEGRGVGHGGAAGDFLLVIRGNRGTIFDSATRRRHLRGVEQRGDEGGLATMRVAYYSDVADILSEVILH